jgi:hypothetical protein
MSVDSPRKIRRIKVVPAEGTAIVGFGGIVKKNKKNLAFSCKMYYICMAVIFIM